ncbi:hypothetical protein INR49_006919 [Caranx melampygus]|nr:hypothetical protein INR49_006919 [Caranx melampygus]
MTTITRKLQEKPPADSLQRGSSPVGTCSEPNPGTKGNRTELHAGVMTSDQSEVPAAKTSGATSSTSSVNTSDRTSSRGRVRST